MELQRLGRREFIALFGGAVAGAPLSVRAQEPGRSYRMAVIVVFPRQTAQFMAFLDELRVFGFIEGQNLNFVSGGFDVRNEQLADVTASVAKSAPDIVICGGDPILRAARDVIRTIPIVGASTDMVGQGHVRSLARPGGNITGVSVLQAELDGKRQEILIEAVPGIRRMAALADPTISPAAHTNALQNAARARGVELGIFTASSPDQIAPAMDAAKASGAMALNVLATPLFSANRRMILLKAVAFADARALRMARDGGGGRA